MGGGQLAAEMNLRSGMVFGRQTSAHIEAARTKHVLILGVNGFIGSALGSACCKNVAYAAHGMDLRSNYVEYLLGHPRFRFAEGISPSMRLDRISRPASATSSCRWSPSPRPSNTPGQSFLGVFKLDFEENLHVIRYCAKYGEALDFSIDLRGLRYVRRELEFDEDNSNSGSCPIRMQRWIYACIKNQMLDRVIWAYGQQHGLRFTLLSARSTGSGQSSTAWTLRASAARAPSPSSS